MQITATVLIVRMGAWNRGSHRPLRTMIWRQRSQTSWNDNDPAGRDCVDAIHWPLGQPPESGNGFAILRQGGCEEPLSHSAETSVVRSTFVEAAS
jgi:hypothetical protein